MTRSHPPALLKIAARTIAEERLFAPGDVVLVAVSGGPDSMALLHVLAKLAPRLGVHLKACGVDHGLRSAAGSELALAERLATDLGVPFVATRVALESGGNLMARARAVRYEALERALRAFLEECEKRLDRNTVRGDTSRRLTTTSHLGPKSAPRSGALGDPLRGVGSERLAGSSSRGRIATGHHADDRAETVLMRLLRGAGPTGLGVLAPSAPPLVRPLIRASRADVMAHIERHRIPYAEDPSNRDARFLRTRVRSEVLPLLRELSPQIVEHLCSLADQMGTHSSAGEGDVPAVLEGISLGRAQRTSLARALASGNWRARVPLKGGKVAGIDLTSRRIMLMKAR